VVHQSDLARVGVVRKTIMSDEIINHGHADTEFEHEDLSSNGVYVFMVGLVVSGIVIYFIIVGMYRFLDSYERSQMATASPLVTTKGTISRVVTQADMDRDFKDNGAPMLETNERGQLRDFLMNQENQLNSYGWIDEKAGVAHIPIERAMDVLIQRGVPVISQGAKANASAESNAGESKPGDKNKKSATDNDRPVSQ
jgi:hypothetical protein